MNKFTILWWVFMPLKKRKCSWSYFVISFGSGVVGYLTTFATGGIGSVLGRMISGSVTDLQSGLIAFGIGAVANVAARGITALINKGVSAGAQKALNNQMFDDMTLGDLVGSGLKNNGYAPAYN